ncbi:MAG: M23 family metallopeptidase [Vicinamibacterales bacterium]
MSWARKLSCAVVLVACVVSCARPVNQPILGRRTDILLPSEARVIEARVPDRTTLAGLLSSHGLGDRVVQGIIDAARGVFDPRRLKARNPYRVELGFDGVLEQFKYEIDTDKFLSVVGLRGNPSLRYAAEIVAYPKERALVSVRGDISHERPSLIAAVLGAGEQIQLALSMADLFSGDIDFNSELQPEDTFDVLVEKVMREGEVVGYGDVIAAEFVNEGRVVRAFRFQVEGEKPGYYDAEGRSIKKEFLKSPLKFDARITSGFSRLRLHPILGSYRAHMAVDYGAPVGAPVVAVASGVVVDAGFNSSGGNTVHLRHAGGLETYYLHLSSISSDVRAGAHVSQGEIIGKVGATGLATGPHLDYRLKKNGQFVNPVLEHANMPPGPPIPAGQQRAFARVRDRAIAQLVGTSTTDD